MDTHKMVRQIQHTIITQSPSLQYGVTRGQLPQRAGLLGLNGGGTAAAVPPRPPQGAPKLNFFETRAYTRRRNCLHLPIFNVQVSTVRYTLITRSGRGFRPGLLGRPVRAGVRRRSGKGRCRRVRAVMPPTDQRLSGSPTSPRQGVVDAAKLTGLQRAVLTIWREN